MTKSENDPETGSLLQPKYDSNGLITAVVTDDSTGELLMLAHMNLRAGAFESREGARGVVAA